MVPGYLSQRVRRPPVEVMTHTEYFTLDILYIDHMMQPHLTYIAYSKNYCLYHVLFLRESIYNIKTQSLSAVRCITNHNRHTHTHRQTDSEGWPQLALSALRGSSKMFGASASNMDKSLGSVFFTFFFVLFFSSVSPARRGRLGGRVSLQAVHHQPLL